MSIEVNGKTYYLVYEIELENMGKVKVYRSLGREFEFVLNGEVVSDISLKNEMLSKLRINEETNIITDYMI